jgi:membrane protein DedA with SNARE-associated domain
MSQLIVALGLFLGTFVLEDATLISAITLVAQGEISFELAAAACFLGISLGDLGLYAIGRWSTGLSWVNRHLRSGRVHHVLDALATKERMAAAVVLSRFVPGTRLPTYLAAGALRYSFTQFFALTLVSVSFWVVAVLAVGRGLVDLLADNWITALFLGVFIYLLLKALAPALFDRWARRAMVHGWRRWLKFEFWPGWLFYIPVVGIYLWHSIRCLDLLAPLRAAPHLRNAGLIGEAKWDFLQHADPDAPSTLPALRIGPRTEGLAEQAWMEILKELQAKGLDQFPLIAKPDVGQRGYAVRIIEGPGELRQYFDEMDGAVIVQRMSRHQREAGLFYIRMPEADRGFLFSITDKEFPKLVGDGKLTLGDLILRDRRARILTPTYFARHKERLDSVIPAGVEVPLSRCGNHCQGAIFLNGEDLKTPQLLEAVEGIVRRIPNFYFGRIDVRYRSSESLRHGLDFEVLEVNGAGSEATHIWDSRTSLFEAYRVLFQQWGYLFSVGCAVKRQGLGSRPSLLGFLSECAKVYFRSGPMTVSS